MNCEHYQYQILTEIQDDGAALEQHKQSCPHCAEHTKQVGVLHHSVLDALQIPVPAHLNEALKAVKGFRLNKNLALWMLLIALLVSIGAFMHRYPVDSIEPLDSKILKHIHHEPFTLTKKMTPTSREIESVFSAFNVHLKKPLKGVTFIKKCAFNGRLMVHLVVTGEKGPVTVLLFPNTKLKKTQTFAEDQLHGILQTTEQGHMLAVVGFTGEPLEKQTELFSKLL